MCSECYQSPCDSRCPNAPEPPAIHTCDNCKDDVRVGDTYYEEPDGEILCQSCVDNMSTDELLRHLGYVYREAEVAA